RSRDGQRGRARTASKDHRRGHRDGACPARRWAGGGARRRRFVAGFGRGPSSRPRVGVGIRHHLRTGGGSGRRRRRNARRARGRDPPTESVSLARLRARWRARPLQHSGALWALLIALDVLPWPWGEDILAALFTIGGLARPARRRAALSWAEAHHAEHPWRLAAALCGFLGHWVARKRALGFRRPSDLRHNVVIEGAEHLAAVEGAAILLGFHVGPTDGDLTFRVLGHPVTFLGASDREATMGWWSE